ncbi:MAG: Type 1 glutamine amidotransferase-like domain-containing protein [Actinomycetota bacterium]|nr:Type 1 glutamine amidotransferase-like domain-containing protein [Actinomycetota bacterium]
MAGILALVGGDELHKGNEPQDEALVRAAAEGPAFVLATAAARGRPDLAAANAVRWFGDLGLSVEELPVRKRADASSEELAARAAEGGFFYLVGGDPGLVLDVLDGSPVWEAIAGAWRNGAALGGSSAGAMVLTEWTLVRGGLWPDRQQRRYKDALGLVPRTAVIPHFDTFGRGWVDSALAGATEDTVLLGLDERTAAVWEEGTWTALGAGGVSVLSGSRMFRPGDRIEGLPQPDV